MRVEIVAKVSDMQEPKTGKNGRGYVPVRLTDIDGWYDLASLSVEQAASITDGAVCRISAIPRAVARAPKEFESARAFISWQILDVVPLTDAERQAHSESRSYSERFTREPKHSGGELEDDFFQEPSGFEVNRPDVPAFVG